MVPLQKGKNCSFQESETFYFNSGEIPTVSWGWHAAVQLPAPALADKPGWGHRFLAKTQHRIIIASIILTGPSSLFGVGLFRCVSLSVFQTIDSIEACQFIIKSCQLFPLALGLGCFPAKLIQLQCHLHTNQCSQFREVGHKSGENDFFSFIQKEKTKHCWTLKPHCAWTWLLPDFQGILLEPPQSWGKAFRVTSNTSQPILATGSPGKCGKCARGTIRGDLNLWRPLGP